MRTEEWNVTVGSGKEQRKLLVKVEADQGGEYRLRIGNEITTVRAARTEAGSYSLIVEGGGTEGAACDESRRQRSVDIDGSLPDLKLTIDGGDPIAVSVVDAQSLETSAGTATLVGEIRAAMPGKVVKVLCKVGDVVQLGQPLLIIEAMKMENELRAAGGGKVESIAVREGQTVEGGQALLVLGGTS